MIVFALEMEGMKYIWHKPMYFMAHCALRYNTMDYVNMRPKADE